MTNTEFARRVGCHHTMASRLRNGHRVPSVHMLARILTTFDFDQQSLNRLWVALSENTSEEARAAKFGEWLRDAVFVEQPMAA